MGKTAKYAAPENLGPQLLAAFGGDVLYSLDVGYDFLVAGTSRATREAATQPTQTPSAHTLK